MVNVNTNNFFSLSGRKKQQNKNKKRGKRRMKSISRRTREQNTFTNYMRCIIPVYFFLLQWMFAATLSLCLSPFLSFFPHLVAEMLFSFSFIITYFISLYLLKFYSRSRFQSLCVLDAPYLCVRSRVFFFVFFRFVSFLLRCGFLHFCLSFMPVFCYG